MTDLNAKHPDFAITYEMSVIEHLGLNLYSEAHSAISELIANAYDADTRKVTVELPIDIPFMDGKQQIIISDDGHGMTFDECRDQFLRIGRNRRRTSAMSRSGERRVIGKKGIGKLAGFGIANTMRVVTISNYRLTEFVLSLEDLRHAPPVSRSDESIGADVARAIPDLSDEESDIVREYKPELIRLDEQVEKKQGTTITLEKLRPADGVKLDEFKKRLTRKFAIFETNFKVAVKKWPNGAEHAISKFDIECQFRFPETGWEDASIETPSKGTEIVRYWIGFTKATIKEDADRGISVMANGKSVQEPFDFKILGGVTGQFGIQYMTGEVIADWLDERVVDVVASDRAAVRWSDPDAKALLQWGQNKIRALLSEWSVKRSKSTIDELAAHDPDLIKQIDSYSGPAQTEIRDVVNKVVSAMSHVSVERVRTVVSSIVTAYQHDHIRVALLGIMNSSAGIESFAEALHVWDVMDAVLTFQALSVKLTAIQTLGVLVHGGATEVKSKSGELSLHEHLAAHPWLIDPGLSDVQHERNIDNFILTSYGPQARRSDMKRIDFIGLYNTQIVRIVEIKSAKSKIDSRGINNLQDYHHRIKSAEGKRDSPRTVRSLLIYNGECTEEAEGPLSSLKQLRDDYEVFTWQQLLDRNAMIYKEQLQRVRLKNPEDPRIIQLSKNMKERMGPDSTPEERLLAASGGIGKI